MAFLFACQSEPLGPHPAAAELPGGTTVEAGPLRLRIYVSRTANLFHMVDELSGWSRFCHRQYEAYFDPSEEDREALGRHARIREAQGWGRGFERTFYTPADLETAIETGRRRGHLSAREAAVELEVLRRFAARADRLLEESRERLEGLRAKLEASREEIAGMADRLARFTGTPSASVPVFLIASPAGRRGGGSFDGGALTVEVSGVEEGYSVFLHEAFHAFLDPQKPRLRRAARGVDGLDGQTLVEGLAYALSPGIFHAGGDGADPLADLVDSDRALNLPLEEPYVRYCRLALELRPVLREMLERDDGTLAEVVPQAVALWREIRAAAARP